MRGMGFALMISLGCAGALAAPASDYRSYANARYAYSICYPSFMTPHAEAPNGDGRTFTGRDGAELAVFGRNNPDGASLADTVRDDAADLAGPRGQVTYRVQKSNWAVFSGANGGKLFYSKTFQRNGQFVIFELTYPRASADRYKPVVENLSRCFRLLR